MAAGGRAANAADGQQRPAPRATHPDALTRAHALTFAKLAGAAAGCLLLANCVSTPAGTNLAATSFDPTLGVSSSPRVVDGDGPIDPKLSRHGVAMVGKPYVVAGKRYVPREPRHYTIIGAASWYGSDFHGRRTANGEVFDMHDITAANPVLPLPCYARVTNLANGDSIVVRVNDRGPYHAGRVIDISSRAADLIEMKRAGIGHVKVEYIGHAEPGAADTQMLAASLRRDGSAATLPGVGDTMLADAAGGPPPVPPADVPGEAADQSVAQADATPDASPSTVADADPAAPGTGLLTGTTVKTVSSSTLASATDGLMSPQSVSYVGVPLPVERPIDLDTVPNADTPVPAGGVPFHPPAHVPLPPVRHAAGPRRAVHTQSLHEAMGDVLGRPATMGDTPMLLTALATLRDASPAPTPSTPDTYVDAGTFTDQAAADTARWMLAQANTVTMTASRRDGAPVWTVRAGPFADRSDAQAAAAMARAAGFDSAAVGN